MRSPDDIVTNTPKENDLQDTREGELTSRLLPMYQRDDFFVGLTAQTSDPATHN